MSLTIKHPTALIAAMLFVAGAQPVSASGMKRILVLGDSLSEGLMLKPEQAWPMQIVDKLREARLDFELTNASLSGDTTEGGLRRLPAHLKRKPDIFIVELGINDAFRGVPIEQIKNNLQTIIDRVQSVNLQVRLIICGMQLPDYSSDAYVNGFGEMYSELAQKNHAALLPYLLEGVAGDPLLNLPDRFHPNAAGHKILAENVWRVLEPVAREVTTRSQAARGQ